MTQTHEERMAIMAKQETIASFPNFNEEAAFDLGSAIYAIARGRRAPVVIGIRTPDRTLFHAAMPGSSPDNDHWLRRKSNIVLRFHQSSLMFGETLAAKGRQVGPELGLDPLDYAAHGGSFPIRVKKTGVIGAVTVSGLPSIEDHRMVIEALSLYLKVDLPKI
ncbi:heme-degrading domain-containing protein [Rhizobium alvei]|uniref:UPF0303 protein Q4481_00300 n=1 Tax=Rhizobium alvei TaxID=1132659 RepID=A0ABT8YF74_9HYPH|nr:heme-degrading domain-containing protein [Rhizobium alvei]MDO6962372.1 heme-degrading domain-containing protein [Rhizobium alvei]